MTNQIPNMLLKIIVKFLHQQWKFYWRCSSNVDGLNKQRLLISLRKKDWCHVPRLLCDRKEARLSENMWSIVYMQCFLFTAELPMEERRSAYIGEYSQLRWGWQSERIHEKVASRYTTSPCLLVLNMARRHRILPRWVIQIWTCAEHQRVKMTRDIITACLNGNNCVCVSVGFANNNEIMAENMMLNYCVGTGRGSVFWIQKIRRRVD